MRVLSSLLCSSQPQPVVEEIIILFNVCLSSNRCLFDLNVVFLTNINYSRAILSPTTFFIFFMFVRCVDNYNVIVYKVPDLSCKSTLSDGFYVDNIFFRHHYLPVRISWERKLDIINSKYMEIDMVEIISVRPTKYSPSYYTLSIS